MAEGKSFEGWSILELMGHRKLAGYVREELVAGAPFVRIDVPDPDPLANPVATQFYAPAAVYCITPVTEELARKFAKGAQPQPVTRWELPETATRARDHVDTALAADDSEF